MRLDDDDDDDYDDYDDYDHENDERNSDRINSAKGVEKHIRDCNTSERSENHPRLSGETNANNLAAECSGMCPVHGRTN